MSFLKKYSLPPLMFLFYLIIIILPAQTFFSQQNTGNLIPVGDDALKDVQFESYDEVNMKKYEDQEITEVQFLGNVKISFQGYTLIARKVIVTTASNEVLDISAFEKIELIYNDDIFLAERASFDPKTEKGILYDVRFYTDLNLAGAIVTTNASGVAKKSGVYYQAKKATIISDKRIVLEDVYFTFSDAAFPHYYIHADKAWYYQDDFIFSMHNNYYVGRAGFVYLPFFMEWERGSTIQTAFGNEAKIGWYLMNSYQFQTSFGRINTGLDVYELLGEYFFMDFNSSKKIGPFKTLNLELKTADDHRIFYDNQLRRYTRFVEINGEYTNFQQYSWYYKLTGSSSDDQLSFNFNWEDLNDPFFKYKYTSRQTKVDVNKLFQPEENQFYNGKTDEGPVDNSLSRAFSMNYGPLSLSGNWNYKRNPVPFKEVDPSLLSVSITNNETNTNFLNISTNSGIIIRTNLGMIFTNSGSIVTTNAEPYIPPRRPTRYENDYYEFKLSQITFPNLSYSPGSFKLFEFEHKIPVSKELKVGKRIYKLNLNEDITPYIYKTNQNEQKPSSDEQSSNLQKINPVTSETGSDTNNEIRNMTNQHSPQTETNFSPSENDTISSALSNNNSQNDDSFGSKYSFPEPVTYMGGTQIRRQNPGTARTNKESGNEVGKKEEIRPENYSVKTNYFNIYSYSSSLSTGLNFSGNETLDTNGTPIDDQYQHNENASVSFNTKWLNNMLNMNHSIKLLNRKRWSSFERDNRRINNEFYSGSEISYANQNSIGHTFEFLENTPLKFGIPLSLNHSVNYQIDRSTYSTVPRQMNHSTTLNSGINLFDNHFKYNVSASHQINFRLTNGIMDTYINNIKSRNMNLSMGFSLYWLKLNTGLSFDLLEKKSPYYIYHYETVTNTNQNHSKDFVSVEGLTNQESTNMLVRDEAYTVNTLFWTYESLTNRIPGGNGPKISLSISPPGELSFLPGFSYSYDIFRQTNISASLSSSYGVKDIYLPVFHKLEKFDVSSSLGWDFLNPRNIQFNMNYSFILWFHPFWRLNFGAKVKNNQIYRYFPENQERYNVARLYFWDDLWNSINITDYEGLKKGNFKIDGYHFSLVHFLNEWELIMNFDISRKIDNQKYIAYWEPSIKIEFKLTPTSDQFPPYEHLFIPEYLKQEF